MLHLKRIIHPYEWERCHLTGDYIQFGEYYYEDDEDGFIISAGHYAEIKQQAKEESFDYSKLESAANEREYTEMLRNSYMEHEFQHVLERKVEKGVYG